MGAGFKKDLRVSRVGPEGSLNAFFFLLIGVISQRLARDRRPTWFLPPAPVAARPALEGKISKAGKDRGKGNNILFSSRELPDRRSIRNWRIPHTPVRHEAADAESAPMPLAMPCLVPRHGGGSVARHEHRAKGRLSNSSEPPYLSLLQHKDRKEKVVKVGRSITGQLRT
nr:hypothetical protein CFOL_v3_28611 [Ipomoea trifida]